MIEEFLQALARIRSLKQGQQWKEASVALESELERLLGAKPDVVASMTETELLARVIQGEPTQAVREKTLIITTLLKEAGELAVAQGRAEEGRALHLKGLHLLLGAMSPHEPFECPDFAPRVEAFLGALQGQPVPLETLAQLMRYYEQIGDFARAEDCLFTILDTTPASSALLEFGTSFYDRLRNQSDERLVAGNLPRAELEAGVAEFRSKSAPAEA